MASDYRLILSERSHQAILDTKNYISHVLLSPQAAQRTVETLIKGLERLLVFPESGFNADERYGKRINPEVTTRALVIDQYIAFYFIDQTTKTIFVTHLFSSKSDYVRLL